MRALPPLGASYRLQLHKDFTFDDARALVPYLERLGVTHLYSSPILKSRPGSTHGYDVADPTVANPELGGEDGRTALAKSIADAGLGLLLDIVPNHMGTGPANPFWEDVLAHGPASRYGRWFDIRWSNTAEPLRGRVLLPVLGDKLPKVIERGELTVKLAGGRLRLCYFDNDFPLDPATWPPVLERALGARSGGKAAKPPRPGDVERLREIIDALRALPRRIAANAEPRARASADALAQLDALLHRSPAMRRRIEAVAYGYAKGAKGRERTAALVAAQPYRLSFWRRAARLINYRRFFDINELVALRMESDEVFDHVHAHVLDWVANGEVHGLRVDHVDGLLDPLGYLERLRRSANARSGGATTDDTFPILVEKILTPGERLREEWPVQGTTGYEFLNDLESVFVEPSGAAAITAFYHSLRPGTRRDPLDDFEEVAMRGKIRILTGSLAPDVRGLAALLLPIAKRDARVRTSGAARLTRALTEWLACFPVYRSYIDGRSKTPSAADRDIVERVARRCAERGRLAPHVIAFLSDTMLKTDGPDRDQRLRFVAKLQQASGPATAKGVEDTALYQYVPLVSLNEVGGDPARPLDEAVQRFHEANAERGRAWPRNLLCTNTHDTKRSADVRARLDVLSEMPELWSDAVTRWRGMNASHRKRIGRITAPDTNSEYLLYQTLLGIWPTGNGEAAVPGAKALGGLRARVEEYMLKAVKEAKLHTSWTDQNEEFENALKEFIAAILPTAGAARSPFLRDVAEFTAQVARPGLWNSLSRIALHMTAPGVPDLYRGDELWNFALVDPDNRRPVDFDRRSELLEEISGRYARSDRSRAELLRELVSSPEDDRTKLLVTWRALQARRSRPQLFAEGRYEPLMATGERANHVIAFARVLGSDASMTIAPRRSWALSGSDRIPIGGDIWGSTHVVLPDGAARGWRCAISGLSVEAERRGGGWALPLSNALNQFPVSVLESNGTG
ncbi:MAG: malto-oligosyltrehalose synthase [Gemmatimonadaceae bacterium]